MFLKWQANRNDEIAVRIMKISRSFLKAAPEGKPESSPEVDLSFGSVPGSEVHLNRDDATSLRKERVIPCV